MDYLLSVVDVAIDVAIAEVASVKIIAYALFFSGPRSIVNLGEYVRLYGVSGLVLWLLGDNSVWGMQVQVLESLDDDVAMGFRNSIQNECTMKAVAGAIVAQIAITALSLPYQHWVARGAWIVSLVTAIMAVYYTNVQHRAMGRLLRPEQIRAWIGGKPDREPAAEALDREILQRGYGPKDFLPVPTSVLTVSAPDRLLSTALNAFLAGLGVYLGVIWQGHLDSDADVNDSKYVFVAYIVSVSVCYIIYLLSSVVQKDREPENLQRMLRTSLERWARSSTQQDKAEHPKRGSMGREEARQPINPSPADNPSGLQEDVEALGPRIEPSSVNGSPRLPTVGQSPQSRPKATESPAPTTSTHETTEDGPGKAEEQLLIEILHESARLRRESAEVDERLAQYLERLLGCPETTRSITQSMIEGERSTARS